MRIRYNRLYNTSRIWEKERQPVYKHCRSAEEAKQQTAIQNMNPMINQTNHNILQNQKNQNQYKNNENKKVKTKQHMMMLSKAHHWP